MATLSEIAPQDYQLVMDLLNAAGVDVSDWVNFKGGPDKAASNPKYCYNWSFVEPKKVVVLNLWHAMLQERAGVIQQTFNMRQVGHQFRRAKNSPRERRAQRMDSAIQAAVRDKLPIRVIVCEGDMRNAEDSGSANPSRVHKRLLDPMPWAVTAYNLATGDCTVTRSAEPAPFVDQFDLRDELSEAAEQREVRGHVFVRSAEVRRRTLLRAQGKCEWCKEPGFTMPDGRVFLETHHVISLADGGPDTNANVVALCPNHHREAHFGARGREIRVALIERIQTLSESIPPTSN